MAINRKEIFKTVPIKGKGKVKGNVEVCNYDNKIVIQPKDKDANKKVEACYDKKPKEHVIGVGADTLQSPSNDWMVIKDTLYYKVPESQKGTVTVQQGKTLGRINKIKANLVFVRYQGTLRKMLKMDKNAPYNFIDAEAAIPYYQYLLKNKSSYMSDPKSMELIAWAEGVDKKVKSGQLSFNGDDSSFTGNTNLDLGIDGNTNLDLSFDGNTKFDLSIEGDDSSSADGEYFYIAKPNTKILAKDKKTGIIHNTKKKLGRGSKIKGKLINGVHKFRVKSKKSGAISTISKPSRFVMIGENDLAQMLVSAGSIKPINSGFTGNTKLDFPYASNTNLDLGADGIHTNRGRHLGRVRGKHLGNVRRVSSVEGNTTLDLSFEGNTTVDLSIQGGRVHSNRGKHLGRVRGRHLGNVVRHSFEGNTNIDLNFDGNTNLNLDFDGGYHRPKIEVVPNNLDLGADGRVHFNRGRHLGRVRGKHLGNVVRRVSSVEGNTTLDLSFAGNTDFDLSSSFSGGALTEDFHGGGDMLYFDGSEEMSNAFGDWVKGIFNKDQRAINKLERREKKALSKEEAAILANDKKVVYTEDEMKALHASSGSTKPFSEWTKSEGAKNMFNSISQFGVAWLQSKSKQAAGEPTGTSTEQIVDDKLNKGEKTILGMHPLTFGIVATVVGVSVIGAIIYFSKKGGATTAPAVAG